MTVPAVDYSRGKFKERNKHPGPSNLVVLRQRGLEGVLAPVQTEILHRQFRLRGRTILILVMLIYTAYTGIKLGLQWYDLNGQIAGLEGRKAMLAQKGYSLQEELALFDNPSYIERLARGELGLIKPGEKVILPARPGEVKPLVVRDPEEVVGD